MKRYFLPFVFSIFLFNCGDDKTLSPSYADVNWYEIQDSSDPTDHLRYEIYKATDISIFYSDTIGKQFRGYDGFGDSIIHYEILDPYYVISASSGDITFSYSGDRNAIRNGMLLLRDHVIPMLNPLVYPRSFLLVERLTLNAGSTELQGYRQGNVYKGMTTTMVSHVSTFGGMSEWEKHVLAAEIAAPSWQPYLVEKFAAELDIFYAISNNSVTWGAGYAANAYDRNVILNPSASGIPYRAHWNAYGFLTRSMARILTALYYTPTKIEDVCSFVQAVLTYSEAEFREVYEGVDGDAFLFAKFAIIKELMDKVNE